MSTPENSQPEKNLAELEKFLSETPEGQYIQGEPAAELDDTPDTRGVTMPIVDNEFEGNENDLSDYENKHVPSADDFELTMHQIIKSNYHLEDEEETSYTHTADNGTTTKLVLYAEPVHGEDGDVQALIEEHYELRHATIENAYFIFKNGMVKKASSTFARESREFHQQVRDLDDTDKIKLFNNIRHLSVEA